MYDLNQFHWVRENICDGMDAYHPHIFHSYYLDMILSYVNALLLQWLAELQPMHRVAG